MTFAPKDELVYVAGPMTGLPDYNHPAFFRAAAGLRSHGYIVICPAELHHPDPNQPWDWYLRRDLAELVKCQTIALLPGWAASKGATLEKRVASDLGMNIIGPPRLEALIKDVFG